LARLDATIAKIRAAGKRVVAIGPVPTQDWNVPRRLARLAARGQDQDAHGIDEATYRTRNAWFLSAYPRWQAQGVGLIDPARGLFDSGKGMIVKQGDPLYFDSHHISVAGARAILAADPRR
jgi:hypothetical protein